MKYIKDANFPLSTADLAFKVIERSKVLEAFPMTKETYSSIFTWPEWLQQERLIRSDKRGKWSIGYQMVEIGDWIVMGILSYPIVVLDEDFCRNFQLLSGFKSDEEC